MRFNNVLLRALSAVLITVLLNSSLVAGFAHVAVAHASHAASDTAAWT